MRSAQIPQSIWAIIMKNLMCNELITIHNVAISFGIVFIITANYE